jgi:hypothetical protein
MKAHRSMLVGVIVFAASHAAAAPLCRPELTIKEVAFSPIHDLHRTWSARIAVDASRCATVSGRFAVDFVRFKETAPDMRFTEQFGWTPGVIEVASDFSADEAVADYTITAATCPCREAGTRSSKAGE